MIQNIQNDEQMLVAEQCVSNLKRVLIEARKVHPPREYALLSMPILLELQEREQEILEYLSGPAVEYAAS